MLVLIMNAFLMVFPNMVMKFHNFDVFYIICSILTRRPHSALACRVRSVNQ